MPQQELYCVRSRIYNLKSRTYVVKWLIKGSCASSLTAIWVRCNMDVLSLGLAELDKGDYYEWEDCGFELSHLQMNVII